MTEPRAAYLQGEQERRCQWCGLLIGVEHRNGLRVVLGVYTLDVVRIELSKCPHCHRPFSPPWEYHVPSRPRTVMTHGGRRARTSPG